MSNDRRPWHTDEEWNRLRERIEGAELPVAHRSAWLSWTAAAAVLMAVAALGWRTLRPREPERRVATTAAGERVVIRLADSSVVTLGPASRARYIIGPRHRELELEGLADFKVRHDPARPFVVRARNAVATDLGTEFVVRAYPGDSTVQVSVTDGLVSVSGSPESKPLELRPGDVGHVGANGATTLALTGNARTRAAWVEGRLVFDDEPLASVAAELSRWFDADIRVAGALRARRVSAVYNNSSLAGVLDALQATFGVRVDRADGARTIVITEAK